MRLIAHLVFETLLSSMHGTFGPAAHSIRPGRWDQLLDAAVGLASF